MGPYTTDRETSRDDQTEMDRHGPPPTELESYLQGRRVYPEPSDDTSRIAVSETLYIGILQKDTSAIVHSPWAVATKGRLPRHRIFARTSDGVYLISNHKVLKRMLPLLAGKWLQAHQSLLINAHRVKTWNDRMKRVAFVEHLEPSGDAVDVSKRLWGAVKRALSRPD